MQTAKNFVISPLRPLTARSEETVLFHTSCAWLTEHMTVNASTLFICVEQTLAEMKIMLSLTSYLSISLHFNKFIPFNCKVLLFFCTVQYFVHFFLSFYMQTNMD